MCLAVLALDAHPRYALVVVANRDEYHARPAAPASWWREGLLAGRDLASGGTWLGLSRSGRFAFVTNIRDPARHDPAAPSRGFLVPEVLAFPEGPLDALTRVGPRSARLNGFNLVAGGTDGVAWTSNRAPAVRPLSEGVHGVSNGLIDDDWPKVRRTRIFLEKWCASGEADVEPLFEALADRSIAADGTLPSTGVSLAWERRLSAVFILGETYGTRCSTVLTVARDGTALFVERSFAPDGRPRVDVVERFAVEPQRSGRSITT